MLNYISKSITYIEYFTLIETLMKQGKTSGSNQTEEYLNYAKVNLARMQRLNKTVVLTDELKTELKKITKKYIWLVITEGWCGDAAQNIPILHFMEKENPNIEIRLVFRDENLDLMDKYLTNGGRSIPILICLEDETCNEIFVWGPRPQIAQQFMIELKQQNTSKENTIIAVQKWYNNDKTLTLQNEFVELFKKLQ